MAGRTPHLRLLESPATLLMTATAISTLSFFFRALVPAKPLVMELILAYSPLLFGGVAMGLCIMAVSKAAHKRLIVLYTMTLAPFAFGYPAWMIILWILYASGRYKGAMP